MIEKSNLQAAAKKVARDTLFSCMSPPTSIETEQDDQGTQDYANSGYYLYKLFLNTKPLTILGYCQQKTITPSTPFRKDFFALRKL